MANGISSLRARTLERAGLPSDIRMVLGKCFEFVPNYPSVTDDEAGIMGIVTAVRLSSDGVVLRLEVSNREFNQRPLRHLEFSGRSWHAAMKSQVLIGKRSQTEGRKGILVETDDGPAFQEHIPGLFRLLDPLPKN
ncbi:MAG: hypothetical protein HY459_04760 [Parcubacteria group bacterium]|nr:hypothetical protein [Parcubacteria group bacterium]